MPEHKHKVVINIDESPFVLSDAAKVLYDALAEAALDSGAREAPLPTWHSDPEGWELDRHDPILVKVVELLGHRASGRRDGTYEYADLQVVEIPGNKYYICPSVNGEILLTPTGPWTVIE